MEYLTGENIGLFIGVLAAIRGVAATIAIHTPNKTDDKVVAGLNVVIDALGGNYGNAKNAE